MAYTISAIYNERIKRAAAAVNVEPDAWIDAAIAGALEMSEQLRGVPDADPNPTPFDLRSYTVDEAAKFLGVTPRMVREHLNNGKMRGAKNGKRWRISADNLRAYINGDDQKEG